MEDHTSSSLDMEHEDGEDTTRLLSSEIKATALPNPHIYNKDYHSVYVRYGIPIFLVATFSLLMASDIGVGAAAHVEMSINGKVTSSKTNLEISVFSSVKKLWENDAYALAVLIVCTSISWPYVKLVMTLYAWVTPFDIGCRRHPQSNPIVFMAEREKLLFWLDIMGKFAFVDSFVLIILMVVFRATVSVLMVTTDVWVTPRWGMYGFIIASVLSLFGTQVVLYLHRGVHRQLEKEKDGPTLHSWEGKQSLVSKSGNHPVLVLLALVSSVALLVVGAAVKTFTFKYSGMTNYETYHSLISIGLNIPKTARDSGFMIHSLQAFYFALTMGIPIASCFVYGILFFAKVSSVWARRIFVLAETALAWSALDVYILSTFFAVAQIPNFAKHLVDDYCKSCFTIEAEIHPVFTLTCAGALVNFTIGLLLVNNAQKALFSMESVRLCGNNKYDSNNISPVVSV